MKHLTSWCSRSLAWLGLLLLAGPLPAAPLLPNPILFVTQVPMPIEANDNTVSNVVVSCVSALGNHLADPAHAARGGDLWLAFPDGSLSNLTRAAGFGVTGPQHTNGIAVRQPCVHWSGTRAVFSMVVGSPRFAGDSTPHYWQLYEVSGLPNGPYVIQKVPRQPDSYNNVSPCYGTDGRIVFASDRPREGSAHLYPLLDEYNDVPTVTGLWSLDPANGELFLMNHTPSGAFTPIVDSYGRVVFTRWDHLVQDRNATDDRLGLATNGTFNYEDESPNAAWQPNVRTEIFPEPRTFDATNLTALHSLGNAFNSFFPWTIFEDGTGEEVLNHIGRHELIRQILPTFTNDVNLRTNNISSRWNSNYVGNLFQLREDPRTPGVYVGVDAPDFGTHGAGQIVSLYGPKGITAEQMYLTYLTGKTNAGLSGNPGHLFRNPFPLSDGGMIAVHTPASVTPDRNQGTEQAPAPLYQFRLRTLTRSGAFWATNAFLTGGLTNSASYWVGSRLVTYTNALWELDPVEVRPLPVPPRLTNGVAATEAQVFAEEGVDLALFQAYLRTYDLALAVSHNVTKRDRADKQQPYNLRIAGTGTVTLGTNTGRIYDLAWFQFLQADQRRGLTMSADAAAPAVPGRRVLATPLHEAAADNLPGNSLPAGSVRLADDGSFAALVPARRAMTWQSLDPSSNAVVRERYWITFQPGEIRTCKNCHGINTVDQAGQPPPENKPLALRELLRYWKSRNTPSAGVRDEAGTNYLAITFQRRAGISNVVQAVEAGEDLQGWEEGNRYAGTNASAPNATTTELSRTGFPTETIVVRDNWPLGARTNRYLRVKVSRP
jgi:hypothetical protein